EDVPRRGDAGESTLAVVRRHLAGLPDLRWTAPLSALMLLWLLPLFFQRVQHRYEYFSGADGADFLTWSWFIIDKTYPSSLPAFLDLYPIHITSIEITDPAGKWLIMGSRVLFYSYLVQSFLLWWAVRTQVQDAITGVKEDPEMAVYVGRRALGP